MSARCRHTHPAQPPLLFLQPSPQATTRPLTTASRWCCSVVAAWAGDSRAVIGTAEEGGDYSATQLTEDHTPHVTSEAMRIFEAGGWVVKVGASDTGVHSLAVLSGLVWWGSFQEQ
jgi:serine/threonine protein phosphatase PrpC